MNRKIEYLGYEIVGQNRRITGVYNVIINCGGPLRYIYLLDFKLRDCLH